MSAAFPPIAELVPHAGPALLLDAVLEHADGRIRARARVSAASRYFVPGRGLPSWVGLELMSQAIAAYAGLKARAEGRPPRAGMLLGTRRYEARESYFPEGAELEIECIRDFGDDSGVAACACTIRSGGETWAEATIIIVEVDEEGRP
ncbi:MAG TPA: 3-hydroxylacyl-ACP dehydratase [Gammaproteobacteria bacterium]|nr:3-hydroxylacyl-ACP dehydratase [Gammaproteobacteria bacterium]